MAGWAIIGLIGTLLGSVGELLTGPLFAVLLLEGKLPLLSFRAVVVGITEPSVEFVEPWDCWDETSKAYCGSRLSRVCETFELELEEL